MSAAADPEPTVLEWGEPGRARLPWWRRLDPRLARLLSGLGVVALFGSLLGEWQVTSIGVTIGFESSTESLAVRVSDTGVWGTGWLVGALLLLGCTGPALFGPAWARPAARSGALALAAGLLALLLGAATELSQHSLLDRGFGFGGPDQGVEVTLGRGVYAAFAALALLGLALWLAHPRAGYPAADPFADPSRHPGQPGEPAQPPAGVSGAAPVSPGGGAVVAAGTVGAAGTAAAGAVPPSAVPPGAGPQGANPSGVGAAGVGAAGVGMGAPGLEAPGLVAPGFEAPSPEAPGFEAPGTPVPVAPPHQSPPAPPVAPPYGGPDDLTVGPAEPFADPVDGPEWR